MAPIFYEEPLNYVVSTVIALIGALVGVRYLAATPGGLDSVAAMATDLKADATLILAVHSLRLVSVVTVGPYLVQFVAQRVNRQSGDMQNSESTLR